MAEILIKARSATNPDMDRDRTGCYKRGDPVVVMEDGHEWGAKETLPDFVVVKIPGVSVDRVRGLVEPQTEDDSGVEQVDPEGWQVIFRRRRWRVLVDNLPLAIRQELAQTGEVTVTATQVRNYIRRIRDDAQFDL